MRPSRLLAIAYSKYLEPVPSKIREADSDSKTDEYSTRLSLAPPLRILRCAVAYGLRSRASGPTCGAGFSCLEAPTWAVCHVVAGSE